MKQAMCEEVFSSAAFVGRCQPHSFRSSVFRPCHPCDSTDVWIARMAGPEHGSEEARRFRWWSPILTTSDSTAACLRDDESAGPLQLIPSGV